MSAERVLIWNKSCSLFVQIRRKPSPFFPQSSAHPIIPYNLPSANLHGLAHPPQSQLVMQSSPRKKGAGPPGEQRPETAHHVLNCEPA